MSSRHPALSVLMVIVGVIMLLPGICAIVFMGAGGISGMDSALIGLWVMCLLVSALGLFLIYSALR